MSRLSFVIAGLALALPLALGPGGSSARAQSAGAELKWAPCGDVPATECATLQVPVDYARPDGAKFALRIGRAPAVNPAKKKGVLLILPGGPGAGIAEELGGMR